MTDRQRGRTLMIASGIAMGMGVVGFVGGHAVHAADISVEGSANCDGPGAWVATWVIRASVDAPEEMWRLDLPGEAGEPRPVAEPAVVELVQSIDEPVADLDAVATFMVDGSTATATSTMQRPAMCASAPAPTVLGETIPVEPSPAVELVQPDVVAPAAASSEPDIAVEPAPAVARPATPVAAAAASANVPTSADTATGSTSGELPATGSTSGILVALALACVAAGVALTRLARVPDRA